jgi:hypothetical protein
MGKEKVDCACFCQQIKQLRLTRTVEFGVEEERAKLRNEKF